MQETNEFLKDLPFAEGGNFRKIKKFLKDVLPFADGLSLRRSTFMSAIAHGLPVVTTRPEQSFAGVESGENVILVPPGDAASLSYAITQFAGSPKMREDYGERARQLGERFSWEANARSTLALYHAVTDVD